MGKLQFDAEQILRKQQELEKTKKRRETDAAVRAERQRRERERRQKLEKAEKEQRMALWGGTVISVGFADKFQDNFALLAGVLLKAMEDFENDPNLARQYIDKYKAYIRQSRASAEEGA